MGTVRTGSEDIVGGQLMRTVCGQLVRTVREGNEDDEGNV